MRPVRDTGNLEGKELEFKVIKLDQKRNNVVVSRRSVVESEGSAELEQLMTTLQEGQETKGVELPLPRDSICKNGVSVLYREANSPQRERTIPSKEVNYPVSESSNTRKRHVNYSEKTITDYVSKLFAKINPGASLEPVCD